MVTARRGRRAALAVVTVAMLMATGLGVGLWQTGAFAAAGPRQLSDGVLLVRKEFAGETPPAPAPPLAITELGKRGQLVRAADNAARELTGSGDNSLVSWNPKAGLWARAFVPVGVSANWRAPIWWQSAIALDTLTRYLLASHNTEPQYQQLIERTYEMGVSMPGTDSPRNFANQFMDDTAWWGLTWLEVARYELDAVHDPMLAHRYLELAQTDARYVYSRPRPCGTQGVEWQVDYPPDTITNEEFVALAAQLAQMRDTRGVMYDPAQGRAWLSEASKILGWLQSSGLVSMSSGTVRDGYNGRCQPSGGPVTYTEGEMADALVAMGQATGEARYDNQAAVFINRALEPSFGMLKDGVLQEGCEAQLGLCVGEPHAYDGAAYKGLFVQAVSDWRQATGETTYDAFLQAQARAVLANAASNGARRTSCQSSPHDCQLGFYWVRRIAPARWPVVATTGTQESGLQALTGGLLASAPAPSSRGRGLAAAFGSAATSPSSHRARAASRGWVPERLRPRRHLDRRDPTTSSCSSTPAPLHSPPAYSRWASPLKVRARAARSRSGVPAGVWHDVSGVSRCL